MDQTSSSLNHKNGVLVQYKLEKDFGTAVYYKSSALKDLGGCMFSEEHNLSCCFGFYLRILCSKMNYSSCRFQGFWGFFLLVKGIFIKESHALLLGIIIL